MTRDKTKLATEAEKSGLTAHPCRICGTPVPAGTGVVLPLELRRNLKTWTVANGEPIERPVEGVEPWLRLHDGCAELTMPEILRRLLGRDDLSEAEAVAALRRAEGIPLTAANADRGPQRKAFGFLTAAEQEKLREAVTYVTARSRGDGIRCSAGPCGWCARTHSRSWHKVTTAALRWANGSGYAPLCASCWGRYDRAGRVADLDAMHMVAEASWLGVRGVPVDWRDNGFKLYGEVADTRHRGHAEPWGYSPRALEAVRDKVYRDNPSRAVDPAVRRRYELENELEQVARQLAAFEQAHADEIRWS